MARSGSLQREDQDNNSSEVNSYLNLFFEAIVSFNICIHTATLVWEVIDVDLTFVFDVLSLLSVCMH